MAEPANFWHALQGEKGASFSSLRQFCVPPPSPCFQRVKDRRWLANLANFKSAMSRDFLHALLSI